MFELYQEIRRLRDELRDMTEARDVLKSVNEELAKTNRNLTEHNDALQASMDASSGRAVLNELRESRRRERDVMRKLRDLEEYVVALAMQVAKFEESRDHYYENRKCKSQTKAQIQVRRDKIRERLVSLLE